MPTTEEMFDTLGNCWTEEFGELELAVHHTLTEPTCPSAIIATENKNGPSWRADEDTVPEAISRAVTAAYTTIIERNPKPMTFPAHDVDEDKRVAKFLAALDVKLK